MQRKLILIASGLVTSAACMLGTTPAMAHQPRVVVSFQSGYPAYYGPVVYARPAPVYVVQAAPYPTAVYGYDDQRWREHQWRKRMWRERHWRHRHHGYDD